ncbi:MAG: hypothetical protein JWQ09_5338 [Segetibacter sp.]|nr:hypothetical protein [Segetibacter sp.]
MGNKEESKKIIILCPSCGGLVERYFQYLQDLNINTADSLNEKKETDHLNEKSACMVCGVYITAGSYQIKVEGVSSDQVKDVAAHLYKQAMEADKEKESVLKIMLRKELTKDKLKQLFVVGSFWIGAFSAVGYFLLEVAQENIDWYRFIGILFALPIFFTLLGAFILKMTSSLKEESFLKLILVTLNLNFKGLKSFTEARKKAKA